MKRAATAILLAGGQSSRMGRDKALLSWQGTTLLQFIQAQLAGALDEVVIASGTVDRYAALGVRGVADSPVAEGPMAGLIAALEGARHENCYVHTCDSPVVEVALIDRLFGELQAGHDAAILNTPEGPQPLCAAYRREAVLAVFREAAAAGGFGILKAMARLRCGRVESLTVPLNLNSPDSLTRVSGN